MLVKLFVPAETAVCYDRNLFQADLQNAANTQKTLRARQAVENREEEGCVYSIPLSDLIGKLLELKYIRSTRAHVPVAVE